MSVHPSRLVLWVLLILSSTAVSFGLELLDLPAAMLLGPMLMGAVFALRDTGLHMPEHGFTISKAVIGTMVAQAITPSTLTTVLQNWPAMVLAVGIILLSGSISGVLLARFGSLPGSTAAWGTTPGGAAPMTAMAQAYGADMRMVAFMQYLRMSLVIITASLVSRFLLGHGPEVAQHSWTFGLVTPLGPTLLTMAFMAVSLGLSCIVPIPAGDLILPMTIGAVLSSFGLLDITIPTWLLWLAYACVGWYVGLRFSSDMLRHALRAVPQMLLATGVLIVLCCGAAWMLMEWLGLDILSAYLATSPGGLDTVAAIALSSHCDVSLVMALQTLRLFAVIFIGPFFARWICHIGKAKEC